MQANQTTNLAILNHIKDAAEFARLKPVVQALVMERVDWILKIQAEGWGKRGEVAAIAAERMAVSLPTVNRMVRRFKSLGWKGLLDSRGTNNAKAPDEFKAFVCQLHFQCQRDTSGREVHRMLIERWRKWQRTGEEKYAIPGYKTPPPAGAKGYPEGWSEDNIVQRFRPDKYELASVRQGAKTASGYLPSILKTRVGTKFGQIVFFDDQDYDVKVAAPGSSQRTLRPQGFNCLDYHSGCFMHHAIRLRWYDEENEKYRTLTQQDFTWFVISYLQKHGYRRDGKGTTFVFEHGTATGFNNKTLSTFGGQCNFDEALFAATFGCVRVERSGLFNQPAFAGMLFRPQSSGNPNHKAPLESLFNLVRNRFAALPGAIGRNRDSKPAEQYGVDHYVGQMMKLWEILDEEHRALMRLPVLTAVQFAKLADAIYEAINARTEHKLEGWEAMGNLALQFRFTPDERCPWLSGDEVAKLPDNVREMLEAHVEQPGYVRNWTMSPAEVAARSSKDLTKLADYAIPLLVPRQWARLATVKEDRTISIKDQMLGPEAFSYVCRFEEGDSFRVLKPGTKVLCYLNPYAPERLVICKEDGAYLGTLFQRTRAGWLDHEAILEQLKERAEMKADLDTGVRPHLEGLMADRAEMKRTNQRLADGKPVLPEEIEEARSEAGRKAHRTAAANRLQDQGADVDWDAAPAPAGPSADPLASLPDDHHFPESI